jgi:hypothetical protein
MISELSEIKNEFEDLRKKYREYLPKVDPALIDDLLRRQVENPGFAPMYMVEVFTEPGLDAQMIREFVIAKTGQCPAIYDKGTHYAVHQRLTLEELKEISNAKGVMEVTGDYSGGLGTWAASHDYRPRPELESSLT